MKHILLYILFITISLPITAQSICGEDTALVKGLDRDSIPLSNQFSKITFHQLGNFKLFSLNHILENITSSAIQTILLDSTLLTRNQKRNTFRLNFPISYRTTNFYPSITYVNNNNTQITADTGLFLLEGAGSALGYMKKCLGEQTFPISKPKIGNYYTGLDVATAVVSNVETSIDTLFNGNSRYISIKLDSFKYEAIDDALMFFTNKNCNESRLQPTCGAYQLSFYTRPQFSFNFFTEIFTDSLNASAPFYRAQNCVFAQKDIQFVDSFSLEMINLSTTPSNQLLFSLTESQSLIPHSNNALRDTTQWSFVNHIFQVQDTTEVLVIKPHLNLDSVIHKYLSAFNYQAYIDSLENHIPNQAFYGQFYVTYAFDSIMLTPLGYENLDLCLNDTSLCLSDSVVIDAYQADFIGYRWSTGDTTPSISISTPGTYTLYADYPCGTLCDDFIVYPSAPDSLLPYQDTLELCPPQLPYTLQADSLPNYLWSTGDTTRQIIAQSSGLYTIESAFYCGVVRDSVYIKIKAKEEKDIIAFTDTLVCAKALPFVVEVADTFQSYAWSNGATTAQNTFAQAGEYSIEVSDGCHTYQDTFRLQTEDLDTGIFVQQHFYCPQDFPINIDGFVFNEAKDTIFSQTQSNTCGSRTDSILLFVLPNVLQEKPSINIIDSCKQLGYYLVNVLAKDTNFSYHWESGNPLQFTTKGGETQQLIISNACSTFKIDTFIAKCPEQIIFALPTAFSPNNDGVNDAFRLLYLNPDYELIDLSIYNRWGSQIFSTDKQQTAWEGKFQNENCPIDEYVYQLKLRHKTTSAVEVFSGSVLLVF